MGSGRGGGTPSKTTTETNPYAKAKRLYSNSSLDPPSIQHSGMIWECQAQTGQVFIIVEIKGQNFQGSGWHLSRDILSKGDRYVLGSGASGHICISQDVMYFLWNVKNFPCILIGPLLGGAWELSVCRFSCNQVWPFSKPRLRPTLWVVSIELTMTSV